MLLDALETTRNLNVRSVFSGIFPYTKPIKRVIEISNFTDKEIKFYPVNQFPQING